MMKKLLAGLAVVGVIAIATVSNASLVGDTIFVSGNGLYGQDYHSKWATIGPNEEFFGVSFSLVFDFDQNSLTVTGDSISGWGGWGDYVFSGFDDIITGFSIASNSGFTGSIVNNFSFDAHSITLDMNNSGRSIGSVLVFNISTTSPVPEPSTALLVGMGLVGLAAFKRKFNNS